MIQITSLLITALSFYHLGLYDLSASIDVIINKTNQKQIYHLGHSLGAAQFYILVSERPEYNKKIKMNINYAPLVIMKGFDHPLMQAISFFSTAIKVLTIFVIILVQVI